MTPEELADLKADADRYRWLTGAWTEDELRQCAEEDRQPPHRPQVEAHNHLALFYLPKSEVDYFIDSARGVL